ncbi:class F sortase [Streptomyces sp. M2CJ-2]|uniref:class F sortase n=1 Tax=Streptomyces sp. M2CJ-2 TaxID=2803948 RepID=UPI0027DB172B|nr:class F sortase [Streptomyces sp. M2CJ-2]
MSDTARGLTGPAVVAAALAVVLNLPGAPPGPASPPPDFGPAAPVREAAAAGLPSGTGPHADVPHRDPPPRRVLVRDVGLDARIRPVGVTGQGAMVVPADAAVAGWYRFGPAPGSTRGSAVLVGHVDSDTGDLGEFAVLYDVRTGDEVEVRRAGAEPVLYRVVSRSTMPKNELPSSTFRRTGDPVLTLVTCAPPFVPERGGYLANLVVTAEPLSG